MDHEYPTDVHEATAPRYGSGENSMIRLSVGDRVAAARTLLEARSEPEFRALSPTRRAQYVEAVELLHRVGVDADADADDTHGRGRRMATDHR